MASALDTERDRTRRRERLSGGLVLDAEGRTVDPGDANPVDPGCLVPTMLTRRELDYLHYLASTLEDRGRVVELGCFLGGSTAAIHAGLDDGAGMNRPVLVYDGFRGPPASAFEAEPQLMHFGIEPDVSFREHYERLHRVYLDQLVIREGLIPEYGDEEAAAWLYPEREPIELLFVDVAKSWGVHVSVVRSFMRHVVPGGVVVQQDIGDFRTPWLVVHMWQLRGFFEPLDRVRGTSTISFRCAQPCLDSAELIDERADTRDSAARELMWDEIVGYWTDALGEDASGWLSGHRMAHALHCGDAERVVEHAERYEDWVRSGGSAGVHVSPEWTAYTGLIPGYLRERVAGAGILERAGVLARASRLRGSVSSRTASSFSAGVADSLKRRAWERTGERLVAAERTEIVLYGAGRHTHWLLGSGLLPSGIRVRCVIDDKPVVDSIIGVDVCMPDDWAGSADSGCVVLPSSDAYEDSLYERAKELGEGVEVWRVYTDPAYRGTAIDDADKQSVGVLSGIPDWLADITGSACHRAELGLTEAWDWADVPGFLSLHSGITSWDAARRFTPRSVELAIFHTDHRESAALDLLVLLPVLKDGALVAMHKIDRARAGGKVTSTEDGSERLFDAWEYQKTRGLGGQSGIRLIRVPDDRVGLTRFLCTLIDGV